MTMIEKLARAVTVARALPGSKPGRTSDVDRRVARAVLTALREPDEGMVEAGMRAPVTHPSADNTLSRHERVTTSIFQSMIDHILQEAP